MKKTKLGKTRRIRGFDINPDSCNTCKGTGVVIKITTTVKIVNGKPVEEIKEREVDCTQCDGTGINFHK